MKRLILFLLLLPSVYAWQGTITLDSNNATILENITLLTGHYAYLNLTDYDSRLNYTYPSQVNFTNDTMQISFIVKRNAIFTSNESLNASFRLTNSYNNNSYIYTLTTHVIGYSLAEYNSSSFITVVNGDYYINISTNLLPKNGSLKYKIAGDPGSILYIKCSNTTWLSCPHNSTFGTLNSTEFSIGYYIPLSAEIGKTIYKIKLTTGNLTLIRNITFVIFYPDMIFQDYVFQESCFESVENLEKCLQEQRDFQQAQLVNALNKYRLLMQNKTCNCQNTTEHLYVGNVEEEVIAQLQDCREDRDLFRDDVLTYESRLNDQGLLLTQCQNNIDGVRQQLIDNESSCLANVFSTSVKLKNDAEKEREETLALAKKHRWNTLFIIIIIATTAALSFIGVRIYQKFKSEEWNNV